MKTIPLILAALITAPGAALAHHPEPTNPTVLAHRVGHRHSHVGRPRRNAGVVERTCYKDVYREQYIPGTSTSPGRVRRWTQQREIPCRGAARPYRPRPVARHRQVDNNSCLEGTIVGGIAGGTVGAVASRDEGRIWAIPLGVVTGALVGCQVDGG